jgi:hypothetical protein
MGTIMWGLKPFGLSQSQLPAAPGGGGPDLFVLSQDSGAIYLQGLSADGIQLSSWTFPESTRKVEMICTDDLGGAIIAAQHQDSYTIYVVGKDGKLRWRHTFAGIRVGYALNYEGLLHLLNQAPDHKSSTLTVWDEAAGTEKFTLTLPESHENELNVQSSGGKLLCVPGRSISNLLESKTSGLFVNTDGDAYLAFTLFNWTVSAKKCPAGSVMDSHNVSFSENDKTVLWRVHPDGSYKETVVEQTQRANLPEGTPLPVASPTGAIIPDGFGGVLLSMRWMQSEVHSGSRRSVCVSHHSGWGSCLQVSLAKIRWTSARCDGVGRTRYWVCHPGRCADRVRRQGRQRDLALGLRSVGD